MNKFCCYILLILIVVACNTAPKDPVKASIGTLLSQMPPASLQNELCTITTRPTLPRP